MMSRPVHTLLNHHRCLRLPVVRSAVNLAEMLFLMVSLHGRNGARRIARLLLWIAIWMGADLGLSFALAYVIDNQVLYEMVLGVFDLGLALLVLRQGLGREVWRYHGAEHKVVNAYEAGADLGDLETVARFSRVHDRCGTNLIVIAAVLVLAGYVLGLTLPGIGMLDSLLVVLALIVALELFRLVVRRPRSRVSRLLLAGGGALQRSITTREPAIRHLQIARAALSRVLELESDQMGPPAAATHERR